MRSNNIAAIYIIAILLLLSHLSINSLLNYFFPFLGHFEWEKGSYGLSRTAVWGRPWLQGSYHHSERFVFFLKKEKCGASWRILESSNEVGLKWDAGFLMGSNLFPLLGSYVDIMSVQKKNLELCFWTNLSPFPGLIF